MVANSVTTLKDSTKGYCLISIKQLSRIAETIKKKQCIIALDLETTGLNPRLHKVVTMQFGTLKNAYILDCRPFYILSEDDKEQWRKIINDFIHACPLIIGHNIKFDYKFMLHHFSVRMDSIADTLIQELVIMGIGIGSAENNGIHVGMEDTGTRYGLSVSKGLQKWSINLDTPRTFYRDGSYSIENKTEKKLEVIYYHPDHTQFKKEEKKPTEIVAKDLRHWKDDFPEMFLRYCAQDVFIPLQIYVKQIEKLKQLELSATAKLENMAVPAFGKMEYDGVYVDREKWAGIVQRKKLERDCLTVKIQKELNPFIQAYRQELYENELAKMHAWEQAKELCLAELEKKYSETSSNYSWYKFKTIGMKAFREHCPKPKIPKLDITPINLGSHAQLKIALHAMEIPVTKTDKNELLVYSHAHTVVKDLLHWKELDKFINAFGDKLLAKIDVDERIHPNINQIGAATGRTSCSSPNWQQIPAHFEKEDDNVRRCVIGEKGNKILVSDLPSIEGRILADYSHDARLLDFFKNDGDLHVTTARLMFNIPENVKVNKETPELKPGLSLRQVAKTINYGLVYGMGPSRLATMLGVSVEDAKELFSKYFEAYEGVAQWLEEYPKKALVQGYSSTRIGRKRFYNLRSRPIFEPDEDDYETFMLDLFSYKKIRSLYERRAKNAPIQGTNADIIKYALILVYKNVPNDVKLVACVHDEIVLECPKEKAQAVSNILSQAMYRACKHFLKTVHIPEIDVDIADYWKKG